MSMKIDSESSELKMLLASVIAKESASWAREGDADTVKIKNQHRNLSMEFDAANYFAAGAARGAREFAAVAQDVVDVVGSVVK